MSCEECRRSTAGVCPRHQSFLPTGGIMFTPDQERQIREGQILEEASPRAVVERLRRINHALREIERRLAALEAK